jgi:ABC-2 type transport system ATP-binding protein
VTDHLIETRQLTKRYGDRLAGDAVDLRVRRGEVYVFLGPNGAGKTTTLRMLLGLARSTSGTARVLGAAQGQSAALARIGMLVEAPGFYPYLSGRDNPAGRRAVRRPARAARCSTWCSSPRAAPTGWAPTRWA